MLQGRRLLHHDISAHSCAYRRFSLPPPGPFPPRACTPQVETSDAKTPAAADLGNSGACPRCETATMFPRAPINPPVQSCGDDMSTHNAAPSPACMLC
jgi:hypothetical protein